MTAAQSSELLIVAIDPGVNGGVVWQFQGKVYAVKMPPTDFDVAEFIAKLAKLTSWVEFHLEDPPMFTGRLIPGSAIGKLQRNVGVIYGAAVAHKWKINLVRPPKWLKAHPVGTKGDLSTTAWKNKLKQRAGELYPDVAVTLWSADALLILDAAKRNAIN